MNEQKFSQKVMLIVFLTSLLAGCSTVATPTTISPTETPTLVSPTETPTLVSPMDAPTPISPTDAPTPEPIMVLPPIIPAYVPYLPESSHRIIQIPADFSTIQEGINQADTGDVVLVSPGKYLEQIDFDGKAVIITSETGPDETIIDGGRVSTVVSFKNEESSETVLHGFTITNGWARSQGENPSNFPFGGGITIINASPTISHCQISWNGANFAGGILVEGPLASPLIIHNDISNNFAAERGGGIQVKNGASPTIQNNLIAENFAMDAAGIEIINASAGIIEGNLISRNIGGYDFGDSDVEPYLDGQDITENMGQSLSIPGGIMVTYRSYPTIRANLITDNIGGGIGVMLESTPIIEENSILNNEGSIADGIFIASGAFPVINGNYIEHLEFPSIRVEHGSGIMNPAGQEINERVEEDNYIVGPVVSWWNEPKEQVLEADGLEIIVPGDYDSIQAAIKEAKNGDTVIVAPGTYFENLNFLGKQITVQSQNPDDIAVVSSTIISGLAPATIEFNSGETRTTMLEGFVIQNSENGTAIRISGGASPTISKNIISDCESSNGAIYLDEAGSPLIMGNDIRDNLGELGGGITINFSSPVIKDNRIIGNHAGIGAGIFAYLSSPIITDNIFSGNLSWGMGSGIQIEHYSTGIIKNNVFSGNTAERGGTISLDDFANVSIDSNFILNNQGEGIGMIFDCHPQITNNLIAHNIGGGVFVNSSFPTLVHNTMVDNLKGGDDDSRNESWGIFIMENSRVTVVNSILDNSRIFLYDTYSNVDVSYSLFYGRDTTLWPGVGNIFDNPRFNSDGNDYHLSPSSPCIDTGLAVNVFVDLEGTSRPQGEGYELGAYEFVP